MKQEIIPDDIFCDSYEKYPMGLARQAYQQGRIDERKIKNEPTFTLKQMLEAITYGFEYHRDSMNDNVDVPNGNKLQWIVGKYVPPIQQKEFIEKINLVK